MVHWSVFATVVFTCVLYASPIEDNSTSAPITTPSADQFVPADSDENITFTCTTQASGETASWAIAIGKTSYLTQIRTSDQLTFHESRGLDIEPSHTNSNSSSITLSLRRARDAYGQKQIRVQCQSSLNQIVRIAGCIYNVILYDPPAAPMDFVLNPSLELEWTRPSNVPPEVPITYTIQINDTEDGGMNFVNSTSYTNFSVKFLNDMLLESGRRCVEYKIFISASNGAGTSPLAMIKDTIPISPDVRNVSRDLKVVSVDLQTLTALIQFPPVMPCNVNSSRTNYTVNLNGDDRTLDPGQVTLGEPITINNLVPNGHFMFNITACNNVTCRTSESRTLNTTDVQTVQLVFFQNNLFLRCSFAVNSQARGCVFSFTRSNETAPDRYNVTRQDLQGSMCTEAPYRRDAYGSIIVMDWEENGEEGNVSLSVTNIVMNVSTSEEYTDITGCTITQANVAAIAAGTSTGLVVVIIALVALSIILLLMAFRIKRRRLEFAKKMNNPESTTETRRVGTDSGNAEETHGRVLYECEIKTGGCKDMMAQSLAGPPNKGIEKEAKVHEGTSTPQPPPPVTGEDTSTPQPPPPVTLAIEMTESTKDMSSGPPPPPPVHVPGDVGSSQTNRVGTDSGDAEETHGPVVYEREIKTGEVKDKMAQSLAAGSPTFNEVIKKEAKNDMSSGPPPPPPVHVPVDVGSSGMIEMEPMESTASALTGVRADHDSPAESGDEVTVETAPLLKEAGAIEMMEPMTRRVGTDSGDAEETHGLVVYEREIKAGEFKDKMTQSLAAGSPTFSSEVIEMEPMEEEKQVEQELDKQVKRQVEERVKQELAEQVKQELEERVKQELEERVKREVEERVKQELEERVKQELEERVKRELEKKVDEIVKLEHHGSNTPLTLKVKWKSLTKSLLARGGNKQYDYSKLKVELEF